MSGDNNGKGKPPPPLAQTRKGFDLSSDAQLGSPPPIAPVGRDVLAKVAAETGFSEGAKTPAHKAMAKPIPAPKVLTEAELIEQYVALLGEGTAITDIPDPSRVQTKSAHISIRSPVHIAAALAAYSKVHAFKNKWSAIEALLEQAGVINK